MRLDVPLYIQEKLNECYPCAIKMVLSYFGKEVEKKQAEKLCEVDENGIIWSIGALKAISEFGFRAEIYSTSLNINPDNYDLEFYKNNADSINNNIAKIENLKEKAVKNGAMLYEKSLTLKEIETKISKDCLAILILDWGIVEGWQDRHPIHAVPITGFDDKFIYVNEPGRNRAKDYKIEKKIFDKARKAPGTDEDVIFVYCK